ncbi:thermonuclease family protein [bacterium]|nr:thermonuclease family protein [bacterium]
MQKKKENKKIKLFVYLGGVVFMCAILFMLVLPEDLVDTRGNEIYRVLYIIDGDTIQVNTDQGRKTVRLLGIDTPEVKGPYTDEECYGRESSSRAKELMIGQNVKLKKDKLNEDKDKYDRLLRYVYLSDNTFVNELLVKEGYAFLYPWFPFEFYEQFKVHEDKAREEKLGLWSEECEYND